MTPELGGRPVAREPAAAKGGFWPLRDLPTVFWLLAALVAAVLHASLPAPRWLLIHLLLLGAVSHSILVWSRYFSDALLHLPARPGDRRRQSSRLALLNGGAVVVVVGVLTAQWVITAVGATAIAAAALWHGTVLFLQLRRALKARFAMTVRYYVVAAALLPVGALLGTIVSAGGGSSDDERLVLAHVAVNVLGWLGLTVLGTLVTLWPTMLRTRVVPGAEPAATTALPVLVGAVVVVVAATLAGSLLGAATGLALYLGGVGVLAVPFVQCARAKPPSSFATWSVLAGLTWLVVTLALLTGAVATAPGWEQAHDRLTLVTPALAVGFAAQVLYGAMSYLMPVVLRGGPSAVRAATAVLERGAPLRLTVVNLGLLVAVLPVPPAVQTLAGLLVVAGFAAFLPLMALAAKASRRAKMAASGTPGSGPGSATGSMTPTSKSLTRHGSRPSAEAAQRARKQGSGLAVAGLALVLVAVAGGVAFKPSALDRAGTTTASAGVVPTGQTTTVAVTADNMRFTPARVEVPAGNRLVIMLHNADPETVHDLVLDTGADSGRLDPGARASLDVGVVGRDLQGWCSVVGHRQMGMVFEVVAVGVPVGNEAGTADGDESDDAATGTGSHHGAQRDGVGPETAGAPARLDFSRMPGAGFTAHPAQLPAASSKRIHRQTFTISDVVREVAPGVVQTLWTYNGSVPGPTLRGKVGDVFEITLVNRATMGHSIDFHAGALAPDGPMRTIPPGGSLVYTFTADRAGIWMYHCSSMPMSAHIANGLFGAVIIDPPDLAPVAHEYLLVQSELYLGADGGPVDVDKVNAERPDAVVFNGYANQYDHQPLTARVGERVRIWVLDVGPNRPTSFHVVGGQFDTVYVEGAYRLQRGRAGQGGSQALALAPAQGGFVELVLPEAGHYPFISHLMVDAERGAHGVLTVGP
ncbi:MAG: multicopper oxidase domain-containing protein [Humibacillus sp.]|nr:multicopper oxidase domain-containing protein [Humibacillus sp.]MDN5776915.1 multicopper oxidase domain-containing protein [Humibacillus sp.]